MPYARPLAPDLGRDAEVQAPDFVAELWVPKIGFGRAMVKVDSGTTLHSSFMLISFGLYCKESKRESCYEHGPRVPTAPRLPHTLNELFPLVEPPRARRPNTNQSQAKCANTKKALQV
jgi:hypothetical protein